MNIKYIGELIQTRRKELAITQRDLARIADISVHALSNIESGKGNPTMETFHKIINNLGMTYTIHVNEGGKDFA